MLTGVWTQMEKVLFFVVLLVLQENSSPDTHELKPNTVGLCLILVLLKTEVSLVLTGLVPLQSSVL